MPQPGYQVGSEPMWWWKVALHLDEAQLALANAMAHNLDDQRPVFDLQDRLREGQAILLEIFRTKGLLPGSTNGTREAPMPEMSGVPTSSEIPVVLDGSMALSPEEPAVPEADQAAVAAEEQIAAASSDEVTDPPDERTSSST